VGIELIKSHQSFLQAVAHSRDKYLRKGRQSAPKASRSSSKASSFCTRAANGKTNDYQTDWRRPNNPNKGGTR